MSRQVRRCLGPAFMVVVAIAPSLSTAATSRVFLACVSPAEDYAPLANRFFAVDPHSDANLLDDLRHGIAPTLEALQRAMPAPPRLITQPGDQLTLFVVSDNSQFDIDISESPRSSTFARDVSALAGAFSPFSMTSPSPSVDSVTYRIAHLRALLKVRLGSSHPDSSKAGVVTKDFVLGPKEHLYLSTAVNLRQPRELKYDKDTMTLEPRQRPAHPLVGVSYLLGDLLSERRSLWQNFYLGMILEASTTPLRSHGWIVGYRMPSINALGLDLEAMSPFVGWVRASSDTVDAAGGPDVDAKVRYVMTWGLALHLDKLLGWIKGSPGSADESKPQK